jgi:hypothetical protein
VCGAIGAELIAEGSIKGNGVVPPEICVPHGLFRKELAKRGIITRITPPKGSARPFRGARLRRRSGTTLRARPKAGKATR